MTSILHVRFLRNISPQWRERKYFFGFCPKDLLNNKYPLINIIKWLRFYFFTRFRGKDRNKKILSFFGEEMRTRKFASEIY